MQYPIVTRTHPQGFTVSNPVLSALLNNWETQLDNTVLTVTETNALFNMMGIIDNIKNYRTHHPGISIYSASRSEQEKAKRIISQFYMTLEHNALRGDISGRSTVQYQHKGDKLAFIFYVLPYFKQLPYTLRYIKTSDSMVYFTAVPSVQKIVASFNA